MLISFSFGILSQMALFASLVISLGQPVTLENPNTQVKVYHDMT